MRNILPNKNQRPILWITAIIGAIISVAGIDAWLISLLIQMPSNHMIFDISKYLFSGGVFLLILVAFIQLIFPINKNLVGNSGVEHTAYDKN